MKQLNLNVTAEFERDLEAFMKARRISRKSEAVRQAMREAAAHSTGDEEYDFRNWLGLGLKAPLRRKPRCCVRPQHCLALVLNRCSCSGNRL